MLISHASLMTARKTIATHKTAHNFKSCSNFNFHMAFRTQKSYFCLRVYYDPDRSFRGAKLCMVKKRTEAKQVGVVGENADNVVVVVVAGDLMLMIMMTILVSVVR